MGSDHQPATQVLVQEAQRGDSAALDELLQRHIPALRAFIRLRCGKQIRDKESCSDLVQSVCREVLGELGRFEYRGEASFRNWLFGWATHKIQNRARYYRAEKRDAAREVQSAPSDAGQTELPVERGDPR